MSAVTPASPTQSLGNDKIGEFRGDAVPTDCMRQIRSQSARAGGTRSKASITLQLKGITVVDEKAKVCVYSNYSPVGSAHSLCWEDITPAMRAERNQSKCLCYSLVFIFWPNNNRTNFEKQGYHRKGHLKGSRMVQVLASKHLPLRSYEGGKNELNFDQNALL